MRTILKYSLASVMVAGLVGFASGAAAYTIDGQISDWGVYGTGNDSDWTPNGNQQYAVSDQVNDSLSGGYVYNFTALGGLGSGGQEYDAEAIYLDYDSTYLYYAVVTGRPSTATQYPAGDIAFDFGSDGSWEFGVETRGNNGFDKGDLVAVSSWALGNPIPAAGVTEILSGTVVGGSSADFAYGSKIEDIGRYTYPTYGSGDDNHYVLEGRIALADFSLYAGQDFTIHWTMGCGNDEIHLSSTLPTGGGGCQGGNCGGNEVPVPGTGLLFGGALIGWTLQRRRQRMTVNGTSDEARVPA
ncbi:MAG: PEP-CTERM sorting domain-containing protein [Gammaproteobacteria bacterium]|nr:PEP-CTERM sorting domain-containing protein [Gammaproteobacteria bacterium]